MILLIKLTLGSGGKTNCIFLLWKLHTFVSKKQKANTFESSRKILSTNGLITFQPETLTSDPVTPTLVLRFITAW